LRHIALLFVLVAAWSAASPNLLAAGRNKKQPVPSADAQAQAMKIIKEMYGDEYKQATTLEKKQALAKTLFDKGITIRDDLPGKFVLLKLSREVATQALDGLTAFKAVDGISETFEVDPAEMKADVLKRGAAHATSNLHHQRLMEVAMPLVDVAISEDNFVVAKDLCDFAASEAQAANQSDARQRAIARGAEVETVLAAVYEKAQSAAPMLSADPINPAANADYGKYLCFVKKDWNQGILMLALGDDAKLKALAQQELDELSPTRPEQLGDNWWDAVDKEGEFVKGQGQARAAYWYRKALPELSGLRKAQVDKRLASVEQASAEQAAPSATDETSATKPEPLSEHTQWTVPYTWTTQEQRTQVINQFNPQTGKMTQFNKPFTATVHHSGTKAVHAELMKFDYKSGNVVLKIFGDKKGEEFVRSFRYVALGKEDKKYLDQVKARLMGQSE
jgi:hypothetical protein